MALRNRTINLLICLAAVLAILLTGCGGTDVPAAEKNETVSAEKAQDASSFAQDITAPFSVTGPDGELASQSGVYTLTSAGEYTLTGRLDNGRIVVEAGEDDEIVLIFSGASISCDYDSPVSVKNAKEVKIKADEGTYNEISDKRPLRDESLEGAASGAVFSACDLDLRGKGNLVVNAGYQHGIFTKKDLSIKNLTLKVTSVADALRGNDSVQIESGNIIAISTAGDAVRTKDSDISAKGNQRGNVSITGGCIELYAAGDGIQAAFSVEIGGEETNLSIITGSRSSYTASASSLDSFKGLKADHEVKLSGGTIVIDSQEDGIHANGGVALENGNTSEGNVTISSGKIGITAGDDGIHADGTLTVSNGYVNVTQAHEGLEGHMVNIEGGTVLVYATDDGVNATSSTSRASDGLITVSGGFVVVEVAGFDVDGMDANGSYLQTGGFVVVSNPNADRSGMMASLDTDASVAITGGIIVALGAVPSQNGPGGQGGPGGGRFGMGGMHAGSKLPNGCVTFGETLGEGSHTFAYNGTEYAFTLHHSVTSGWIWAAGITSSNYKLS